MTVAVIELKEDSEVYLLPPAIARELPGEFVMVDDLHGDQSARRAVPVAGQASRARWAGERVAPVGAGSGRDGHGAVGARQGEHVARRV